MRQLVSRIARRLFRPSETIEGYEHPDVVEVVFQKTVAYEPEITLPLDGASTVLDYGGGCGRHYKEARSPEVRWAVVETPAMAARARELQTDKLRFFTSISEAADWLGPVDVMHSNGALHFPARPEQILKELCELGASRMVWDRMHLSKDSSERSVLQTSNLVDNGPGIAPRSIKNKSVKYPYTLIPESNFLKTVGERYLLTERGDDWFRFSLR